MAVVTFSNIKGGGGGSGTLTGITFLNSDYTLEFIESAVTEAVDSALTDYTKTEDFATINGSAITEGGNIEIEGTAYSAGTNIDITDNIISVTGITVPTKVSELQNDSGYITTADTQDFVTSADVKTQIEGYDFVNSGDVQTQINESISGKADSSAVTSQISEVKSEIEAEIPSKVSDLQNDLNFASTGDVESMISGFTTSADVKTQIESYNYINSGQAQTQIDNSISGKADTSALTQYYTSAETNTAIDNAVSGKMDTSGMTAYATTAFTEETYLKETSLEGLFDSVEYVSSAKTIYFYDKDNTEVGTIDTTDFVKDGMVDNVYISGDTLYIVFNTDAGKETIEIALTDIFNPANYYTKPEVDSAITAATAATTGWVSEQGYLTEHQSLSAYSTTEQMNTAIENATSGKVDTSAMTQYYTSAETNTAINNATSGLASTEYVDNSVSGKADSSAVTADIAAATAATTGWVENQGYLTGYTESDPVFMSSAASGITANDIQNWNSVSGKQDTLISGTNIKTINNESILGSGNIVISGGSGSANIIELTQAEYNALTAYTEDAMYVITDAQEINMDNYATTGALDSYYTSAETDTAISNAVSGKTDKVSVTANTGRQFPRWNSQGVVTGTTGNTVYERSFSVNGTSKTMLQTTNSDLPTIYAPGTAGTAGQPLLSNGSGAPVWGSYKFSFITQTAYDQLTPDSTTIYFIVGD